MNRDRELEFAVDRLENRLLLAAEVSVRGDNVNVIGDETADEITVYVADNTIHIDSGGETTDTGLSEMKNLKIVTKDSGEMSDNQLLTIPAGDTITISNDVHVTNRTLISMGPGDNTLYFGGLHKRVRIKGGKDADYVVLDGGIGAKVNAISLGGGDDHARLEVTGYADAALGDTPLADYLSDLLDDVDFDDVAAAFKLIPKIRGNLGGGNDVFDVTMDGSAITEAEVLDGINFLADELGFDSFSSVDEAAEFLQSSAEFFNIKIPQFLRVSGGGGNDVLAPASLSTIIDLFGSAKSFEDIGPVSE